MTTQDKDAAETLTNEVTRLRAENEALRAALANLAYMTAHHWASTSKNCVMLSPDGEASARAFQALGRPNPCLKDQAK